MCTLLQVGNKIDKANRSSSLSQHSLPLLNKTRTSHSLNARSTRTLFHSHRTLSPCSPTLHTRTHPTHTLSLLINTARTHTARTLSPAHSSYAHTLSMYPLSKHSTHSSLSWLQRSRLHLAARVDKEVRGGVALTEVGVDREVTRAEGIDFARSRGMVHPPASPLPHLFLVCVFIRLSCAVPSGTFFFLTL